jgi:hypothetical protein
VFPVKNELGVPIPEDGIVIVIAVKPQLLQYPDLFSNDFDNSTTSAAFYVVTVSGMM